MKYYSTKDKACARAFSLREAVQAGLAPDGGLFVPERIPQADMAVAERLAGESYAALAGYLAELFFGDDIDPGLLRREMERIYDFPLPLRRVGSRYTLELFHGPTFAFKDYGAGFMGRMIGLMGGAGEKLVILTATSGDTGSAVAHGFYGVPGVEVVLLYPEGKISRLQECQMTALGGNIHPLRVAGTFDDCQRLVKELFADAKFRAGHRVSSANSINLLRWIPQAFYYFYGYFRWRQASGGENPVVVVPSGNYGNLSAGMLARRMGLPLGGFVAASNANDVVPEFLRTGDYRPRPSVRTPANAMDVGAPSNFERMMWLCGLDADALRGALASFSGVKRRFEFYVNTPRQVYMDDYAHHPRELAATLTSVRKMFPGRRITALFQPHLYTRTRDLYEEFAESLSHADEVVLLPIYPAREEPIPGVTSELIARRVAVPCRIVGREALADTVAAMDTDVVVSFGAGNIDACCGALAEKLEAKS